MGDGGALLWALSPPALAYAPRRAALVAGTLLAGAALCALRCASAPRLRYAYGGALMLALLPWLEARLSLVGVPVAVALVRWTLAERRGWSRSSSAELMLASLVFFARSTSAVRRAAAAWADRRRRARRAADYLGPRRTSPALWLDRDAGLLRWAPVLALAFFAGWLLWRSRRDAWRGRDARAARGRATARLLLAVCRAQWLVAAFAIASLTGLVVPRASWLPTLPCAAALAGWALRHAPRVGRRARRVHAWSPPSGCSLAATPGPRRRPASAFGPLRDSSPDYAADPVWPAVFTALVLAAIAALAVREWRAHPLRA